MAEDSAFDEIVVQSFGGGVNTNQNPAFIRDDEWSWAHNVMPKAGAAECARPLTRVLATIASGLSSPIMLGAFPDPSNPTKILVALSEVHAGSRVYGFHLYIVDAADPGGVGVVEVTPTDIRPACSVNPVRSAVLNGKHILSTGCDGGASCKCSIVQVDASGPTYSVIVTPGTAVANAYEHYFDGVGLNDFSPNATLTGYTNTIGEVYTVRISSAGTPDAFRWKRRGTSESSPINITGGWQTLEFGVEIKFTATTGHTVDDRWHFCVGSSLQAEFMLSFGGYLILAYCDRSSGLNWNTFRTVAWCSANDPLTWKAALSNSADDLILDDSKSPITGLAELAGNRVAVYTDDRTFILSPTARIPAFARTTLAPTTGVAATARRSANDSYEGAILVATPNGLVLSTKDSIAISVGGEQRAIDVPVHEYIYQKFSAANAPPVDYSIWMQEHRQVLIPTNTNEIMTLENASGAWGRMYPPDLGAGVDSPGAFECLVDVQGETGKVSELWVLDGATIWRERDSTRSLPANAAWVDTKDFHVGHDLIEINSILVDWEGLSAYDQNWLQILHSGRDSLCPSAIANQNRKADDSALGWTALGTLVLSTDAIEKIQVTYRYHRLRFKCQQGRFRVRGFKILYRRCSER